MKSIEKLEPIIADLKHKANKLDQANTNKPSHKYFAERRLFSPDLFSTFSDKYLAYVIETEKKCFTIKAMLKHGSRHVANDVLGEVERQIAALTTALGANDEIHHEAQIKLDARKQFFAKKAAKNLMQNSHQLYQTLSEYHEFERRLKAMIDERMLNSKDDKSLNEEVLALHQRLGRCRKAISQVERQIELFEKTNS